MKFKDLTNKKFGRLTVLNRVACKGKIKWLCKCECGNTVEVFGNNLMSGRTKSCGCLHDSRKGLSKEYPRLYLVWNGMKTRCYNTKHDSYKYYGGKGITVCEEWHDLGNFIEWALNNGYDEKAKRGEYTIDRIDINKNYEPSNCRWVTMKVQANNKSTNYYITYKNETHTLTEWSEILGIPYNTLRQRLINNWSIEKAFVTSIIK